MTQTQGTQLSDALSQAFAVLPVEQQDDVREGLFRAAAEASSTGKLEPVQRYIDSLLATARLHRNPAYRKSVAEVDDATSQGEPAALEVGALFAYLRGQRA